MIHVDEKKPVRCDNCNADDMGCQVKRGLASQPCCDDCTHEEIR